MFKEDDFVSSQMSEGIIGYGCVSSELFDDGLGGCDGSVERREVRFSLVTMNCMFNTLYWSVIQFEQLIVYPQYTT